MNKINLLRLGRLKLNKINLLFVLKVGIGSAVAIIVAETLGLMYSPSAGIITLLTVQNTKKETLLIASKRVVSFLMAVFISYIMFGSMGYNPWVFGGFVLVFVGLSYLFNLKDGISMNAVLMTHFLIEKRVDGQMFANEASILAIGMGIGIVLNLIMPNYKKMIKIKQLMLEEEMKKLLKTMALTLKDKKSCLIQEGYHDDITDDKATEDELDKLEARDEKNKDDTTDDEATEDEFVKLEARDEKNKDDTTDDEAKEDELVKLKARDEKNRDDSTGDKATEDELVKLQVRDEKNKDELDLVGESVVIDFRTVDSLIDELIRKAYEDAGNILLSNTRYLISYLEMRKHQIEVLKVISRSISDIPVLLKQSIPLANFMEKTSESFHEMNNVKGLLEDLNKLTLQYKKDKLPVTRDEFEYRAILYQILNELEYFLLIKRNFVLELEDKV